MHALINANVLLPEGFKPKLSLIINEGQIIDITTTPPKDIPTIDVNGDMILPGFIDLQVNGGGGVLFNDNPTIETIRTIAKAHRKYGTTGFMPTLISDNKDKMRMAINAVMEAIDSGMTEVLGIHLEGPFLNPDKKGVHNSDYFCQLTDDDIALLSSLKNGKTLITLAPEKTTPCLIKKLAKKGVIISAGHSMASYDETKRAIKAGLSGFTHLFNAMRPIHHREPGLITAALLDARCYSGIIADGHHVHEAIIKLALKTITPKRMFLVTDAMPIVGSDKCSFMLGDEQIIFKNSKCQTMDGRLAGSALNMLKAVENCHKIIGVDLHIAVQMASIIPAKFINMAHHLGQIKIGYTANLIRVSEDLTIKNTCVAGVWD